MSDNDLWVSYKEYSRKIEELALMVYESGWKFDQVLCLARGGLRPGDIFSRIFNVPLAILSVSSYHGEDGKEQGELNIADNVSIKGNLSGKVLLIDDLVDSGITLEKVQKHLNKNYTGVDEIKTAVIWYKECSILKPDFYIDYLPNNPWIHQPFEEYDNVQPYELRGRLENG